MEACLLAVTDPNYKTTESFSERICLTSHEIRVEVYPSNEGPMASLITPPVLLVTRLGCFIGAQGSEDGKRRITIEMDTDSLDVISPHISEAEKEQIGFQMRERLFESRYFPKIRFEGTMNDNTVGELFFDGSLNLHGVASKMTLTLKEELPRRYLGKTVIRQSDFGLIPLSAFGGALRNRDEVLVVIKVSLPLSTHVVR